MPSRSAFITGISQKLKDPVYRKIAIKSVDILQSLQPSIHINFEDGSLEKYPFIDIVCQTMRGDNIMFEDLIYTALLWQEVCSRNLIYRVIQVCSEPKADADVEGNRQILQNMISHPKYQESFDFKGADFHGGQSGADGYIHFNRPPITDYRGYEVDWNGDGPEPPTNIAPVDGKCTEFPLEVGYCLPDQILANFIQAGCVARFPYGSDIIFLLERVVSVEPGQRLVSEALANSLKL